MLPGCHASITSSPMHSITHCCHFIDPLPIRFPLLPFCLASRAPILKIPRSSTPIASINQTTAYMTPRQSSPYLEPLTIGDVERWNSDFFPLSYVFTILFTDLPCRFFSPCLATGHRTFDDTASAPTSLSGSVTGQAASLCPSGRH